MDGGFADSVTLGDMKLGAVLPPVHQGCHQLIRQTQLGGSAHHSLLALHQIQHLQEQPLTHPSGPFELPWFQILHCFVPHGQNLHHQLMKEV